MGKETNLTQVLSRPCKDHFVSRAFKSFCLLLAILWVPMTQHCLLEAAEGSGVLQCDHSTTGSCTHDGCRIIEEGSYKTDSGSVKLPPPSILTLACLYWIVSAPELEFRDPRIADEELSRPLNWVPAWQFVRRAAPPARAPSLLG